MMNKKFYKDQPIILGLAGKAATGKTSVAEAIVPKAQINAVNDHVVWDHIFFALPLYELVSIKSNIRGLRERERQLYAIHNTLYDLFGGSTLGNMPDYSDLTSLVHRIWQMPLPSNTKPRTFLQTAGDLCREYDSECFAKWAIVKCIKNYRSYIRETESDEYESEVLPFCIIVSDVRFKNEADIILKQPNGIVVCYEASDEVRTERMLDRDGHLMTSAEMNHKSEQEIDMIRSMSSAIIDSSDLSVQEQTNKTIEVVNSFVKQYA